MQPSEKTSHEYSPEAENVIGCAVVAGGDDGGVVLALESSGSEVDEPDLRLHKYPPCPWGCIALCCLGKEGQAISIAFGDNDQMREKVVRRMTNLGASIRRRPIIIAHQQDALGFEVCVHNLQLAED